MVYERVKQIAAAIADIRAHMNKVNLDSTIVEIDKVIYSLSTIEVTENNFGEFTETAQKTKDETFFYLKEMLDKRIKYEVEEAERKAADKRHRAYVKRAAVKELKKVTADAVAVFNAIDAGNVPHVSVGY